MARGLPHRSRRSGDPGGARSLVPRSRRHLGARAGGRPGALLPGPLARLAARAGCARDRAREGDRQAAARDRPHGALRRALPLQGEQSAPGPVAREAAGQDRANRPRPARHPLARLQLRLRRAHRTRGARARRRAPRGARPHAARGRGAVARAGRARVARGPQRRRQDHVDRGAHWPPPARGRPAQDRAQRQLRLPLPAHPGARLDRHSPRGRTARHRPHPRQGARSARPVPVLGRGGGEAARRPVRRRAAPALARGAGGIWGQRAHPGRAHQPPRSGRPRGARGRPAGVRRRADPGVARPRSARRGRQPHGRLRGRCPAQLRRRLGRVRASP